MHIDFNASERSSLGVEMELEIVDRDSRQLANRATELLGAVGRGRSGGVHPKAKHELLESTVEMITGICATPAEARADLERTLGELVEEAEPRGLGLMCSGTHPFSDYALQEISPDPRYHRLVEQMQWTARRLQIFGIHVHVGVRSADKAIAMVNALAGYIPHFLALSASSPYWMAEDTGLASCRSKIFEALPTAGVPQQLSGWSEFEEFMTTLICARSITSIREVWWDIRPHPNFGTIELRICDGLPTLREVTAVAALSQCLVDWLDHLLDRGYSLPVPKAWVVRENKWRAARYGIDAEVITDDRGRVAMLRHEVRDLVDELTPVAARLGCEKELRSVNEVVELGPSYLRQRAVLAAGGTFIDVVDLLLEELRTDRFGVPERRERR